MLTHCPITGVRLVPFILCAFAGFAFSFALDFIVHGNLLMPLYEQTASLWRVPEEMEAFFPMMTLHQFLFAAVAALIFSRHYEAKGVMEGVRFGVLIGLLSGVMISGSYAWMPIPFALAIGWFICEFARGIGLGVIFALLYRR